MIKIALVAAPMSLAALIASTALVGGSNTDYRLFLPEVPAVASTPLPSAGFGK